MFMQIIMLPLLFCIGNSTLNFNIEDPNNLEDLPRFWKGSGLSPAAPLPFNQTDIAHQLLTKDMFLNMEYVASLPNSGIKYIRIHWLLSLVVFKGLNSHKLPEYDFETLDKFLDHLIRIKLFPVIEIMGDVFPNTFVDIHFMWKDFVYQFYSHYLFRYGQWTMSQWRFELWNEPDLRTYNIHNYTLENYLQYVYGVRSGLDAAARRLIPTTKISLRGPAGLFKSAEIHKLCWGLIDNCNTNISLCPIDVITFHRKGINSSGDILTETIDLLEEFHTFFPNLNGMPFSNSEADPTPGWSKNITSYTDVHYAHMLASIIFQHWNAHLLGLLNGFESISHDNSFLSYPPFEFSQRTLLARFMINNTHPKTVKFIQKPVYAALGMLSALAKKATKFHTQDSVNYILTLDKQYAAVLLLSTEQYRSELEITINIKWNCTTFGYFAEFIDQEQTNPYAVWLKFNKPSYPNETVLFEMQRTQGPHAFDKPRIIEVLKTVNFQIKLHHPWIILVRICALSIPQPSKIKNIRIHKIDQDTILIAWHDNEYINDKRCIQTYEIYYTPNIDGDKEQWRSITENKHIPFLSYVHHNSEPNQHLQGYYKIRGMDFFGRFGKFSKVFKYQHQSDE